MLAAHEPTLSQRDFRAFQKLIYDLSGISLADSKTTMVQCRLAKRLRALELNDFHHYFEIVNSGRSPGEVTKFINALTTNKTEFFRENHHFDFLLETVFPQLQQQSQKDGNRKLRIWCSASSTGEEPYSIAMTVREFFGIDPSWDIRILASDIDTDVLNTARNGSYSPDQIEGIPKHLLHQYFDRVKKNGANDFCAKSTLRDLITFRQINLQDPNWPIHTAFDVIFCRNVMIYFDAKTQQRLTDRFAKKLRQHGYLLIGHSETLSSKTHLFKSLGNTIYAVKDESCAAEIQPATTASSRQTTTPLTPHHSENRDLREDRVVPASPKAGTLPIVQQGDTIIVGQVRVSREPIWIKTLLGSCVAACLFDDVAKVGGMNHFRLPNSESGIDHTSSLGIHAMELLINGLMMEGANRRRLKAKIFGGSAVIANFNNRSDIGERNIQFAEEFLMTEGIPIVGQFTGGEVGMKVYFHTASAKALVKLLDPSTSARVDLDECATRSEPQAPDITLF